MLLLFKEAFTDTRFLGRDYRTQDFFLIALITFQVSAHRTRDKRAR